MDAASEIAGPTPAMTTGGLLDDPPSNARYSSSSPKPESRMPPFLRLLPALALAALLAACAQGANPPPEAAAQPPAQGEPIPRGERVIGHQDEPAEVLTPEKARAQCWMRYEKDKAAKNLDAKIVLVDKCVAEKLRGQ